MNTRNLPASALLVVIGAGVILFIGAFARFDPASPLHPAATPPASPPPLTQDDPPAEASAEPPLPANLSPGLSELIKLAQAHVDESVILAYVKNSHEAFAPTAEEILYLSDLGLSQDVIGALVESAPPAEPPPPSPQIAAAPMPPPMPALASASPAAAAIQPEADASASTFYNDLAPYGSWLQQPGYGLVWQPTVDTINSDWSPYVDAGQWLYSDSGWYWQSDYTWGWAVFHYGRWANIPHRGWVWQPGNIWSPAWVAWRSSSSYIGWAPLPPGVGLNVLAQLTYHGQPAGPKATFGLPASAYTFVNIGHLASRNLSRRAAPASQVNALVQSSVLIDSYALVNNRIFNSGANPEAVATARGKAVSQVALRAVSSPEAAGLALDRTTLAVYVPAASSSGGQSAANTPRPQATEESLASQESAMLAENDPAEAAVVPVVSNGGDGSVQLPPLHYPLSAHPPAFRRPLPAFERRPASGSAPIRRDWPRGFAPASAERSPPLAARFEEINPPGRQVEPPHFAVESHPAPVEPVHVAASSSASSAKSVK